MYNKVFKHIVTVLIMASYLPMVMLSAVHVHHNELRQVDMCKECLHSVSHSGHFDTAHNHHANCPVCLFQHLSYTSPQQGECAVVLQKPLTLHSTEHVAADSTNSATVFLRAPPRVCKSTVFG